jgi:hypothetical protein
MAFIRDELIEELEDIILVERAKGEIHDFCEEYTFHLTGDRDSFNSRFNEGELWRFLLWDRTEDLFNDMDNCIIHGANFIIFIHGPGRFIGKSEAGFRLEFKYQKRYRELKGVFIKKYYGFDDGEMMEIFPQMKQGDIAMRDESPTPSGEGSATIKKNLTNICNITRGKQVCFIFVNPQRINEPGIDYYLEAAGMCREKKETRFLLYNRNEELMGVVYLKIHNDDKFRKEYVKRKNAFIDKILALSGGDYVIPDVEKLMQNAINLYEYCSNNNARSKLDVETYLENYNLQFKKTEDQTKQIVGTGDYIKRLIHNVYKALRREASLLDDYLKQKDMNEIIEEEEDNRYIPNENEIQEAREEYNGSGFVPFLVKWYNKKLPDIVRISEQNLLEKEIIVEILESWAYGLGIRKITHNYEEIDERRISQGIVNDITILFKDGKRNNITIKDDWRIYRCYEDWCSFKFNLQIISGHGKADFILLLKNGTEIKGECKIWDDQKGNIRKKKEKIYHTYKEYNAKKEQDPDFYIDSFPVLWRNVKWGDQDFFYDISINGDIYFNHENDPTHILNNAQDLKNFYEKKYPTLNEVRE